MKSNYKHSEAEDDVDSKDEESPSSNGSDEVDCSNLHCTPPIKDPPANIQKLHENYDVAPNDDEYLIFHKISSSEPKT